MSCKCEPCSECEGDGYVWWTFDRKKYLKKHRCDDLDVMDSCDDCGGAGLDEMCDECTEDNL